MKGEVTVRRNLNEKKMRERNRRKNWPNVIPKYEIGHWSNKNVGKSRQPPQIKLCIVLTQWELLWSFVIGNVASLMRLRGIAFEGWKSEPIRMEAEGANEIVGFGFGFGFVEGKGFANWIAMSRDNCYWNRMKGVHSSKLKRKVNN